MPEQPSALEFVYAHLFERTRKGVLSDEDMRAVEDDLLENPIAGAVVSNAGGVRKTRAAQEGHGKRGSGRVAYLYIPDQQTIYFLLAFPKNVQGNLTDAQKKALRRLVKEISAEEWPRKALRK